MKLLLASLLLFPAILVAQKNIQPLNTAEIIQNGIALYDEEKYTEALEEYEKVSINDTNYVSAQYEMALTCHQLEEYGKAKKILEDLLDYKINYEIRFQVYVELGNIYDDNKEPEKALEIFTEGLKLYPYQHNLLYNRGLCYERLKRYKEAVADYQAAINGNMYHAASHQRLGIVAVRMGLYEQGLLSMLTSVWLAPNGGSSRNTVATMEQLANGTAEIEALDQVILSQDPYADFNEFYVNKTALQNNYKIKQTISCAYGKQLDLFLKNNKYDKNSTDFWNVTYLPFYSAIYSEKKLDQLIMLSLISVESEDLQKKLNAKTSSIKSFYEWSKTEFDNAAKTRYMNFEGKDQWVKVSYDKGLNSIGRVGADGMKQIGTQYTYFTNGQLELKALLDENGETIGTWELYAANGTRNKSILFNSKSNKTITEYFDSGEREYVFHIIDDQTEDSVKHFYRNGSLEEEYMMLHGEKNGVYKSYYPNGAQASLKTYKNGVLDGEYKTYHVNGAVSDEAMLADGKLTGKRNTYYPNKQLASSYNYAEDLREGEFAEYYANGQLKEKGSFKKGSQTGENTEYFINGSLSSEAVFDESGKENGLSTWYDLDGKKYMRLDFSKGSLNKLTYIDKTGKETELASARSKKMDYVLNYPNGAVSRKGQLVNDNKNGRWEYFDRYGNLIKAENYKEGTLVDTVYEYFSNGQLSEIYTVKDGEYNGLYLSYNIFGDLLQEGMYVDGNPDKDWYTYNQDGSFSTQNFFANGVRHGYQMDYGPYGSIRSLSLEDYGRVIFNQELDTSGNVLDEYGEYNGEVRLKSINNKFDRMVGNYKNGNADGHFAFYNSRGKVSSEGDYLNGDKVGTWKGYDPDGKISSEVPYVNGSRHGTAITYHDNGKVASKINYQNGEAQGEFVFYYKNGQVDVSGTYVNGDRHGKVTYYGPKGEVATIRDHDHGVIISYTYLGTDGKEVAPVILSGKEMNMVTYYKNGKKSIEHKRVNGLIEGPFTSYYENGQKYEVENYLHGEQNGKSTMYSETGAVIEETDYVKGEKHGWVIEYYGNGKIKKKTPYIFGDINGIISEYSPEGKLVKEITYYVNDEVDYKTF